MSLADELIAARTSERRAWAKFYAEERERIELQGLIEQVREKNVALIGLIFEARSLIWAVAPLLDSEATTSIPEIVELMMDEAGFAPAGKELVESWFDSTSKLLAGDRWRAVRRLAEELSRS